jgi:hypothetical protein
MTYTLTLKHHYDHFATVKIDGEVRPGHNIKFKDLLYRVLEISGSDITVTI